jgi:hypothetical protein
MENTVLKTRLYYNPWIENPKGWPHAVKAHLPQAEGHRYIKRFADGNPNWPQQHKVNLRLNQEDRINNTQIRYVDPLKFLKTISRY